jgi:hypothetical protein
MSKVLNICKSILHDTSLQIKEWDLKGISCHLCEEHKRTGTVVFIMSLFFVFFIVAKQSIIYEN